MAFRFIRLTDSSLRAAFVHAYKFTIKTLKGAEGLVGAEREYAELYRNAIVSAYIEGASVALEKAQRYYCGEEHS